MPFSNVVLRPNELALVKRVFDAIIGEPWFVRTKENEHSLASAIVREFEKGMIEESGLAQRCLVIARERYSTSADETDLS